jgi:hypothetical protein
VAPGTPSVTTSAVATAVAATTATNTTSAASTVETANRTIGSVNLRTTSAASETITKATATAAGGGAPQRLTVQLPATTTTASKLLLTALPILIIISCRIAWLIVEQVGVGTMIQTSHDRHSIHTDSVPHDGLERQNRIPCLRRPTTPT